MTVESQKKSLSLKKDIQSNLIENNFNIFNKDEKSHNDIFLDDKSVAQNK